MGRRRRNPRTVRERLSQDRKSTRLNSSHLVISYAVFCLKKKTTVSAVAYRSHRIPIHEAVVVSTLRHSQLCIACGGVMMLLPALAGIYDTSTTSLMLRQD